MTYRGKANPSMRLKKTWSTDFTMKRLNLLLAATLAAFTATNRLVPPKPICLRSRN